MSIHTFFKSLTGTSTRRRPARRRPPASRPCLEPLEDRCLLSFTVGGDYPVGNGPSAAVAADLNGDGRADLAVANFNDQTVSVLLSNGNGTFESAQSFPTSFSPSSIAAGDFNGDGKTDLVTANQYGSSSYWAFSDVLLGNGDGTYQSPKGLWPPAPPPPPYGQISYYYATDVAVADVNADGKQDLLFTCEAWWWYGAEDGGMYRYSAVSLGQGNGGFSDSFSDLDGGHFVAADLNADGKVDMVGANSARYGLGDGTFTGWQAFSVSSPQGDYVAVGDFNGDGKLDIAANGNDGFIRLGNGDGTVQPAQSFHSGPNPRWLATADFNGDGKTDLVTTNAGDSTVTVCLGNGNGTFQAPLSFPSSPTGGYPQGMAVADFNLDGRVDVAVVASGSNLRVLLNDGIWTSVSISDVTVTEGNAGTRNATFTVTLAAASGQTVTVAYATAAGTASAGSDYQATSGTLTFAPGETSKTITVLVNGDRLPEPNETFFVKLSSPTNAVIADDQGMGTVLDDEPRISISDVTKKEGNGKKTTLFVFTVTLSAAYDQAVTMSFRTVDGTATTSDGDFVAQTGTLTFNPGETTKTITIEVKSDSKQEADETFYLDLFGNSSNALFTKNRGLGTILTDD